MGGVNGSLLRRLVLVEERAPRPPAPVEEMSHGDAFWLRVYAVAPPPVWQYFCQVDAECQADVINGDNSDAWLKRHHPAFDDVLEGLARSLHAVTATAVRQLPYIQGWTIQWAEARLGMAYATERPGAGVTTSTVIDRVVQERAAFDLLGWTIAESYRQWSDPCAFLEQWRSHFAYVGKFPSERKISADPNVPYVGKISADMLAKAGLFDAELALLEAVEE